MQRLNLWAYEDNDLKLKLDSFMDKWAERKYGNNTR